LFAIVYKFLYSFHPDLLGNMSRSGMDGRHICAKSWQLGVIECKRFAGGNPFCETHGDGVG
jgi:hypothetical protein